MGIPSLPVLALAALWIVLAEVVVVSVGDLVRPRAFLSIALLEAIMMLVLTLPVLSMLVRRPASRPSDSPDRNTAVAIPEGRAEVSSLRALGIVTMSIVLAEIVAMAVVERLPLPSFLTTTLIDAFVMIVLGFPVLYFLSFRPLVRLADSRARVQKQFEAGNRELEAANQAEREARAAAEAIRSAAIALTQTLDLDTVLVALLERLEGLVPFDRARVMLREGESLLRVRVVRERHEAETLRSRNITFEPGGNSVLQELLATARGVIIPDTHTHAEWGARMRPGFEHSWMGIPLVAGGKSIGLYSLSKSESGFFREEQLRLAEALSAPASVAIQNAILFEELRAGRESLKTLSRKLVDLQENERRSVARELHDEAGQALTSLKIGLRLLERTTKNTAVVSRAAHLLRTVDGVQESLHRLAANLRPASLDHLGLVPALSQLVDNFSKSSGAKVELETIGLNDRLPESVETDLYRIAQEAVTNAVRHARAKEIGVVLQRLDGRVKLVVEDDGCGFDTASAGQGERLGLVGIRERAETLGGTLLVESSASSGTMVVVEAPDGR
ncbi:MAG TPA: GAF domain-containing sensor histidine kinase [Thermoanaerobaculia bacterium]